MADIRVNDIFDELIEENLKITECLNVLIKFKSFVDLVFIKLKSNLESNYSELFDDFHKEVEDVFKRNEMQFSVYKNTRQTKLQSIESLSSKPQTIDENSLHLSSEQSLDIMKVKSNGLKPRLLSKKKKKSNISHKTKAIEDNHNITDETQSFVCDFIGCGKSFTSLPGLRSHLRTHSTDPRRHKCPFEGCHYSTDKKIEITVHINSHKGIRPFSCHSCERRFTSKKLMKRHIKAIHEIADQILICGLDDCLKEFVTEMALKNHQVHCHLKEKRFVCEEPNCSFKAINGHILRNHIMRAHSEERPFVCHIEGCSKAYKCNSELKKHIQTHTSERVYRCQFDGCVKAFKTDQYLKKHTQLHTNTEVMCDWPGCEYTTVSPARLRGHQTLHSTERHYTCNWSQCGKQFKTKYHLETHQRIHKNDKRYSCSWPGCQYRCTDSGNLIKHRRVHMKQL